MYSLVRRYAGDENGNVAIIFSIASFAVLGMAALAITTGDAYSVRSKTQLALDAAVVGAAAASYDLSDEGRIALAHRLYASDRTARADGTPEISVGEAPSVKFAISKTMVTGEVEFNMTSPFLGVFGEANLQTKVISAARRGIGVQACVLGLDRTEEATIDFNGKANLEVQNCAAQANSSNGQGMRQAGSPSMKAEQIGVTGGFVGENYVPPPIAGTTPIPDPLAALPVPGTGACHALSGAMIQQATVSLTPGTYCGGLTVKASTVATMNPGVYIFLDGPLSIDSQAQVRGKEVMLAFLGPTSSLYLYSGAVLDVTSPTSGTYANIQFFGDRNTYALPGGNGANGNNAWFTVIGDSRLTYDGVMYVPTFHVWLAGGSIVSGKSPNYLAIGKKLWFQDNTQVTLSQVNTRGLAVPEAVRMEYGAALYK